MIAFWLCYKLLSQGIGLPFLFELCECSLLHPSLVLCYILKKISLFFFGSGGFLGKACDYQATYAAIIVMCCERRN